MNPHLYYFQKNFWPNLQSIKTNVKKISRCVNYILDRMAASLFCEGKSCWTNLLLAHGEINLLAEAERSGGVLPSVNAVKVRIHLSF